MEGMGKGATHLHRKCMFCGSAGTKFSPITSELQENSKIWLATGEQGAKVASGLLSCSWSGKQLRRSNVLRRRFPRALVELGFEKVVNHTFRRFRDTFLRSFTNWPQSELHFSLGWGVTIECRNTSAS